MSIIELAVILTAAVIRYWFAPFEMELADSGAHEKVIFVILAVLLYFGNALLLGKMLLRSGLSSGQCKLPMPIFGVLACGVFVAPDMLAASISSLCFAVALYLLLRSLNNVEEKDSVFIASVLLGTTVIFYPPCIVLAAVIPIAVLALALSLRQAVLMLVGYTLPVFVVSYIKWYGGAEFFDFGSQISSGIALHQMLSVEQMPYLAISMAALVLFLIVWGVIYAAIRPTKIFVLTRVRRAIYLFLWVALVSLTMIFIPGFDLSTCAVVAVPLTILLSFALDILPNNLSTLAYWTLLILFIVHLFVA